MVMKDKLEKTNHKAAYYFFRKISFGLLIVLSAAFIIAVPTYIVQKNKKNSIGLAEENSSEVVEEENEGESLNELLSF